MKTTLDLPDALFRAAKRRAADEGVPFREVVERALRAHLAPPRRPGRARLRWHVVKGHAPPAVPVEDRDRLFDFMDGAPR